MAHDGSREVEWKGKAFPFLLHHPNSFLQTENYGSHKNHGHGSHANVSHGHATPVTTSATGSDAMAPAGTGTWNGPAPRGYLAAGVTAAQASAAATAALKGAKEPDSVRLNNGAKMPLLGLGTFSISDPQTIKTALELGYRHFDCASAYQNQDKVGEGLREFIAQGRREELFITSKLHPEDFRPENVRPALEKTLAELGCQYLDLYLMHWPEAWVPGGKNNIKESVELDTSVTTAQTWAALEECVDARLIKAIGVSNFSVKQVEDLLSSCRIKPAANQVELHPFLPQRKLVGVCFRKGVQCVAYSPLGGVNLMQHNDLLSHPTVAQVAAEAGKTPAQVLLRWNMQRGVPVIPKASSPAHLKENLEGAFEWALTSQQKALLDGLECGKRFICPPWKDWGNPEEGGAAKVSNMKL